MSRNLRKAGLFVALTYMISLATVGVFLALGGKWSGPYGALLGVAYMFVPMLCAIIVQRLYGEPVVEPLGVSFHVNRWWWVAWLVPPIIACATLCVSLRLPGVTFTPGMEGMFERFRDLMSPEQLEQAHTRAAALPVHPFWLGLLGGLIAGATVNAVAGFGEELGWRGLLQRELAPLGFWRSSLAIGAIWGLWHAPLVWQGHNYPQHPHWGVLMMTAFCTLLGPVISYIRLRASSVIAAAIFHGTLNGTGGLALIVISGGNDLTVGTTGLAGMIVLAIANLVVYAHHLRRAAVPRPATSAQA